jgi:hypothetical protein
MRLTKWERLSAYQILLAELKRVRDFDIGICHIVFDLFSKLEGNIGGALFTKKYLPELKRGLDKTYKWWGIERAFPASPYGKEKRIELLKSCITQLEIELKLK